MDVFRALAIAALFGGGSLVACGSADSASTDDSGGECHVLVPDAGDTIPEPPDGASLCPVGNNCNYQSQTGCAAGESCRAGVRPNSEVIISFCEAVGTRGTGVDDDPCETALDCALGYVCPEDKRCHKLCCGRDWSDGVCNPGYGCYREYVFRFAANRPTVPTGAYVCDRIGCDVLTPGDCPSGTDCKIIDPSGNTACMPPSPEKLGERCTPPSVCGAGLSCVGEPGEERCRRLCRAEECGDPGCGPGEGACVHFNRDPDGVGECTPGWE